MNTGESIVIGENFVRKGGYLTWQILFGKGLTFSQMTSVWLFKMKEFAEDNSKFDENGRKFSKQVENIVGRGEIACCPFPTVFLKALNCRHINTRACFGKG